MAADYDDYMTMSTGNGERWRRGTGDDAGYKPSCDGTSVIQQNQCIFRNTETPVSDASSFRDNIRGRRAD